MSGEVELAGDGFFVDPMTSEGEPLKARCAEQVRNGSDAADAESKNDVTPPAGSRSDAQLNGTSEEEKKEMKSPEVTLKRHPVQPLQLNDHRFTFVVSHVNTPHTFYVQPVTDVTGNLMSDIRETLTEYAKTECHALRRFYGETQFIVKGGLVCARYTEDADRALYRAQILSLTSTHADVFYVDYGNSETIVLSELYPLQPKLQSVPGQAVRCGLANVQPIDEEGVCIKPSIFVVDLLGFKVKYFVLFYRSSL